MDPMQELLQKLVETDLLNEETKTELTEAVSKHFKELQDKARQDAITDVTAELQEKWLSERDILIAALDKRLEESVAQEIEELKGDIERFRDLEVEYNQKIAEAKEEMVKKFEKDMADLVESLDTFVEMQMGAELTELKESIEEEGKKQFGRKLFEAFRAEFEQAYHDEGSIIAKLNESEAQLKDAMEALQKAERRIAIQERESKLQKVLQPLSGRSREVMEAILEKVDTPLLEEAYSTYIGRVLKESTSEKTSEKETKVLAEATKKEVRGKVVDGTDKELLKEQVQEVRQVQARQTINEAERIHLRKLAGLV